MKKIVAKSIIGCAFLVLVGCSSQPENPRSYDFITELRKDLNLIPVNAVEQNSKETVVKK